MLLARPTQQRKFEQAVKLIDQSSAVTCFHLNATFLGASDVGSSIRAKARPYNLSPSGQVNDMRQTGNGRPAGAGSLSPDIR
ncbi:hypothetical protein ASE60_26585 [Ensifer sp. Root278]|nr:hypothetical protein ASE60_26585 [Ensifer sp. Root278]